MKGTGLTISTIYGKGGSVSFEVDEPTLKECIRLFETLKDKDLSVEIKQYREKRSLDANAYCWVLCTEMANAMTKSGDPYTKEDMYIEMLKRYGQSCLAKIRNEQTDTFERITQYWERHEKLTDENAVYYKVYVGSSNYNTEEMSILLTGIVSECKELGIPIETPEEISRLTSLWGGAK